LDRRSRGRDRAPTTAGTDFPLCYLTTTGRKSGKDHVVPLLFAGSADAPIITGTNFGGDHHPGWALNLRANPAAILRIGKSDRPVRGRILSEEERLAVWPELIAIWPGYDGYVERSGRTPLTFALEAAG
jgi:deazaflavin-dependent oxidoreductase (nitroreductase family)